MEYCREPRSGREIIEFLGLEYRQYSRNKYIKPLLESGRLKPLLPKNQANRNQRFIHEDIEIETPTDDGILEYCKTPRRKKEIREHFGLNISQAISHVDPLIADGRLKMTDPNNPQNYWQRYTSAIDGVPITDEEIILDFCATPRTRQEIADRLGIHIDKMKSYTQPLVDSGKLKMTKPMRPTSKEQQFYVGECDVAILSEESFIEYCREPKTRKEIDRHFGLTDYTTKLYLTKFVAQEKIKVIKLPNKHPRYQAV